MDTNALKLRREPRIKPTELTPVAIREVSGALNLLLADTFALRETLLPPSPALS